MSDIVLNGDEKREALQLFHSLHAATAVCFQPSEGRLDALVSRASADLLQFWRAHGWCSYMNGLFRTVDPDEFLDVSQDWGFSGAIVFGRSGFGDILLILDEKLITIFVHTGRILVSATPYAMSLSHFVEQDAEDLFFGELYNEAVKVHGVPTSSEMFTFEPALSLGGEATLEHVRRVPMKPALSILSQLHDKLLPF